MHDWQEKLMRQLDDEYPNWYIHWADAQVMHNFTQRVIDHPQDIKAATNAMRWSVANKILRRVCRAAISAGIVTEVKDA